METDEDRINEMAETSARQIFYENYHRYPDTNENTEHYKSIYKTCHRNAVTYFQKKRRDALITVLLNFMSEQELKRIFYEIGVDFEVYKSKHKINPEPEYRFKINKSVFMFAFIEKTVIPYLEEQLGLTGLKPNKRLSLESTNILDWSEVNVGRKED